MGFREVSCNICSCQDLCSHYKVNKGFKSYIGIGDSLDSIEIERYRDILNSVNYDVGDCIIVIIEGKWYPGIIKSISKKGIITTTFYQREDKSISWPKKQDIQKVCKANVLCQIQNFKQTIMNKKETQVISDEHYDFVEEKFQEWRKLTVNNVCN